MPEDIRPWQAQQSFQKAAGAVKAPLIMEVVPGSGSCQISWTKRPGIIEGYIILLGPDPAQLIDEMQVKDEILPGERQTINLNCLFNGQTYFVAVIAFASGGRSEISSLWKFVPNQSLLHRKAEKVPLNLLPRNSVVQGGGVPAPARQEPVLHTPKPIPTPPPPPPRYGPEVVAICGGCRGEVVLKIERRLYVCRTCQVEYVQRASDDKFIPTRLLTDGICLCCEPRRPLVKAPADEKILKCSKSGEFYTRKADQSGLVKISELEYGICSCCVFRYPLVRNGNNIVCSNQPTRIYIRNSAGQWIFKPPEPESGAGVDIDEIDRALAEGSAVMLPGGVLSTNSPRRPRRRRRS
ncbi:MAG: fibronectin type III domain-containing protein [bacterium]|nr:fibronectin type III domain-containing protein [bacterium]